MPGTDPDLQRRAAEGSAIADIGPLERELERAPDDPTVRAKILGHFAVRAPPGHPQRAKYQEQALWFVRNLPTDRIAGAGFVRLHRELERPAFDEMAAVWRGHLRRAPKDLRLIEHAASFLTIDDPKASERLWRRAIRLAPRSPRFRERLGHHLLLRRTPGMARKALACFEAARRLTRPRYLRFYQLGHLAEAALAAGAVSKATRYAKELLKEAPAFRKDWNYGNALNHGHTILGRIALRRGRVDEARAALLASAETPGSPQLDSFGPSFTLCRELLDHGEWATAAAYLDRVGAFWKSGRGALKKWSKDIAARRMPDFDHAFEYPP